MFDGYHNDHEKTYLDKTIEMSKSSIAKLETDAASLGLSVDALIQESIQRYVEWDRYLGTMGMVLILPSTLRAGLDLTENDAIEKIAERMVGSSCIKDIALLVYRKYDLDALLGTLSLLDRFGNNYRMQRGEGAARDRTISCYHNFGKKWSLFIGTIVHRELLSLKVDHKHEISENAIVIQIKRRLPRRQDDLTSDHPPRTK